MKSLLLFVIVPILCSSAWCDDGIFEVYLPWHSEGSAEGDSVSLKLPLKARPDLKGVALTLDRYGDEKQPYTISMELAEIPRDNPKAVIVHGKKALLGKLNLGGSAPFLSFEIRDLKEAKDWLKFLQSHFKIEAAKVKDKTSK